MAFDELDIPRTGPRAAAPLSYRRHAAESDGGRRLLIIGGGVAAALLLLVGAMSLGRHGSGGVPVVRADPRPVRVRPADPGGMHISGTGDDELIGDTGRNDALAAPDERPNLAALRGRAEALARSQPAPPAAVPPAASTAQAAPVTAPPSGAPAPTPTAPTPAAPAPAVNPAPATAAGAAPGGTEHAASEPHANAPVAAGPAVAAAPAAPVASAPAGAVQVQLAALNSEAAARAEWKHLASRAPALLAGHQPEISRTTHGDHVFWRLRTSGFADVAAATRFCVQMRALGAVCSLANF